MKKIIITLLLCTPLLSDAIRNSEAVEVYIAKEKNQVCFSISPRSNIPHYLSSVDVREAITTDKKIHWQINIENFRTKVRLNSNKSCVLYGVQLKDFKIQTTAIPLELNTPYQVEMYVFPENDTGAFYVNNFCLTKKNDQLIVKKVIYDGSAISCSSENFKAKKLS